MIMALDSHALVPADRRASTSHRRVTAFCKPRRIFIRAQLAPRVYLNFSFPKRTIFLHFPITRYRYRKLKINSIQLFFPIYHRSVITRVRCPGAERRSWRGAEITGQRLGHKLLAQAWTGASWLPSRSISQSKSETKANAIQLRLAPRRVLRPRVLIVFEHTQWDEITC